MKGGVLLLAAGDVWFWGGLALGRSFLPLARIAAVNLSGAYGPFRDTPLAGALKVLALTVRALVEFTSAFIPLLSAGGGGFVLNVASTAAFQPVPWQAVFAASKAFVLSFSEGLAVEPDGTETGVSALCPGPTDTDFQELACPGKTRSELSSPA